MAPNVAIAQAQYSAAGLLDRLGPVPVPSPAEYVAYLEHFDPLVAVLLLGAGLVVLLQGWRIFRVWVVVTAAMIGVLAGDRVGLLPPVSHAIPNAQLWCSVAGGLLLAALSWPLIKFALGLIGGLTGGLLGHGLMQYLSVALDRPELAQYSWIGAIAAGAVLGMSAFFLFRMVVIVSSSLQGAAMLVTGVLGLLLKHPAIHAQVAGAIERNSHVLPVLIGVPALIGILFQFFWTAPHRPAKKE